MARFDHLIVAVTDLDGAIDRWAEALATPFTRAGKHPYGTENALGLFASDCYLELITGPPGGGNTWLDILATPGPVTYALSTNDLDGDLERLRAAGFETTDAVPGERALPDGGSVYWRSALLGGDALSRDWPFVIEWPTTGAERLGLVEPAVPLTLEALELGSSDPTRLTRLLETLDVGGVEIDVREGPPGPRAITLRGAAADDELQLDGLSIALRA
jgi:hypothetical protein